MTRAVAAYAARLSIVGSAAYAVWVGGMELVARWTPYTLTYSVIETSIELQTVEVALRKSEGSPRCIPLRLSREAQIKRVALPPKVTSSKAIASYTYEWCGSPQQPLVFSVPLDVTTKHGRRGVVAGTYSIISGAAFPTPLYDEKVTLRVEVASEVLSSFGGLVGSTLPSSLNNHSFEWTGTPGASLLTSMNLVLGQYQEFTLVEHPIPVRAFFVGSWSPERITSLRATLSKITSTVLSGHSYQRTPHYTILLLSGATDNGRIAGESGALGTTIAVDSYANQIRAFELLVHRLTHTWAGYQLDTVTPNVSHDLWWSEGVASWYELHVLEELGVAPMDTRANALRALYAERIKVAAPSALSDHEGEDSETLHYLKAPLVMLRLDQEIRTRTQEKKSLRGFLFSKEYTSNADASLRECLALYSGLDLTRFFERFVDSAGSEIP